MSSFGQLRVTTSEKQTGAGGIGKGGCDCAGVPALCELVWVLSQAYKVPDADIAEAVRRLINSANVLVNGPAMQAGLAMLDAGGDFADGINGAVSTRVRG
jgi:predicted nucleic-acid-binding protein